MKNAYNLRTACIDENRIFRKRRNRWRSNVKIDMKENDGRIWIGFI
jgi:hypothetical protein